MAKKKAAKKILIIEDHPETAEMLQTVLEMRGYQPEIAYNGKRGLESIRAAKPDLILLDIMMPEMNGIAVCNELKADPKISAIPIIILSVKAADEDVRKGLASGAVEYVTKPFDPNELIDTIKKYV